eukprot:g15655.t1
MVWHALHALHGIGGSSAGGDVQGQVTNHLLVESWWLGWTHVVEDLTEIYKAEMPVSGGEMGYDGDEGIFVPQRAMQAGQAEGIALDFYKSYNASWHKPWRFFMNITVMNLTDDFMPCVDTMLVNNATGYYYWKLTGDDDGVVITGQEYAAFCENGYTWMSPSCRNWPSSCVIYLTGGNGWGVLQGMQRAAVFNIPLGIAVARSWSKYVSLKAFWYCLPILVIALLVAAYYMVETHYLALPSLAECSRMGFEMMLNFVQNIGVLSLVIVPWPEGLKELFEFSEVFVLSLQSYGLNCTSSSDLNQKMSSGLSLYDIHAVESALKVLCVDFELLADETPDEAGFGLRPALGCRAAAAAVVSDRSTAESLQVLLLAGGLHAEEEGEGVLTPGGRVHCKRPLTKSDITYRVSKYGVQYQAIVTLSCLSGQEYAGHLCPDIKAAEKSAAQQALLNNASLVEATEQEYSEKKRAASKPLSLEERAAKRARQESGENPAITPKTDCSLRPELNSLCMRIIGRFLKKGETVYICNRINMQYQATVQISCLPDEWGQRAWAGHLCPTKQKAEQSAAEIALKDIQDDPHLQEMARQPKGKGKGKGGFWNVQAMWEMMSQWWGWSPQRERIVEEDILGEIVEWKGPPIRGARSHAGRCLPFGGIRVEGRREEHEAKDMRGGKIYLNKKDLEGAPETVAEGQQVRFKLYVDGNGLGAEEAALI